MKGLGNLKPEHMAIQKAIQSLRDLIKDTQLRIGELQAVLPVARHPRLDKKDRYVVHPVTKIKKFY